MLDFTVLAQQCAPAVSPILLHALVKTESAFNPYAIGLDSVDKRNVIRQPTNLEEAVTTAQSLKGKGLRFSVGLAQIHMSNVSQYGLSWKQAFDPCINLATGQTILWNFFHKAIAAGYQNHAAIWATLRGYNSGNVNKAISNDYAMKIFTYMNALETPRNVQVTASTQPLPVRLTAFKGNASIVATKGSDESQEMFEKEQEGKQGF